MFRRLQTLTLLAGAALVAACGEARDTAPTAPELQIGSGPTCSPSNVKKYAKALAGATSPLYNYAQQFTSQNANSTFATNLFFDLAAEAATLARPGNLSDAQQANLANLLAQGIACADVVVSDETYPTNSVIKFDSAAGSTGMLEVRGRPSDTDAIIFSHNKGEHGSAGVKAPTTGFDATKTTGFAAWYGGRAMFYGFPIEPFSIEVSKGVAFEIFTVRPSSNKFIGLRGAVALCVAGSIPTADQFRIQKAGTILPVVSFDPCPDIPLGQAGSPLGSVFAWLGRRLLPQPLHATSFILGTKPAGSAATLSPLEAINPLHATLSYNPAPSSGIVGDSLRVNVHAAGDKGTNWEGVLIKIRAQDNNGRFVTVSPDTATTNALGIANFTGSRINKAGVYQLLAVTVSNDPDITGFTPDSLLSGNFLQTPN